MATRFQADRDLVVIEGSMGTVLDPSADDAGITSKMGIDATCPFGQPFADKLVMDDETMEWARHLADRL
jgi:3-polyprenyl-4-hydroxybenzoate decarboxylase